MGTNERPEANLNEITSFLDAHMQKNRRYFQPGFRLEQSDESIIILAEIRFGSERVKEALGKVST